MNSQMEILYQKLQLLSQKENYVKIVTKLRGKFFGENSFNSCFIFERI